MEQKQKNNSIALSAILRLAWPAVVQEALAVVVAYADTAMVGALGAEASAAVGLTGGFNWLIMSLAAAIGVGVLSVCAQADGAGDDALVQRAGQQALVLTIATGLLLMGIMFGVSPWLATWLGGDPAIRAEATAYFRIIASVQVFRTATMVLGSALRGVSDMRTPMLVGVLCNVVNIVLNFLFIYPTREIGGITVWGLGLGVKGAAIATAISFVVGGSVLFVKYLRCPRFGFFTSGIRFDAAVLRRCLSIGLPAAVQRGVICMGHTVFGSLIARLGVVSLAAHTIAIQAEQAFYIPGYGFQSAAATLAGNAIGERNEKKLRRTNFLICTLAGSLLLAAGILLFLFAPTLMRLFTPDPAVIELGAAVLRIVSLSEPIFGIMVILEGTFNGMGDTKAPVVFAIITMWGVRIFGSFLLLRFADAGLRAVWVMMVLDNVLRCTMLLTRFLRGGWRHVMQQRTDAEVA